MSSSTNAAVLGNGFHHLAIKVRDFDASLRFYSEALGMTERLRWGEGDKRAALMDAGNGSYMEIFAGGADLKPEGVLVHFALRTPDTDAAFKRAVDAGAKVRTPPRDFTIQGRLQALPVRIAFVFGPDGEIIEFFQNELT